MDANRANQRPFRAGSDGSEIRYAASNLAAYARQLDFFGIELGAVGGGMSNVDYATRFSHSVAATRSGKGSQEQRLYMTWRAGLLQERDRELLRRAGIREQGRIVMQFYPAEVEAALARLELEHANGRAVEQIQKTVLEVRPLGLGFEFVVVQQSYR